MTTSGRLWNCRIQLPSDQRYRVLHDNIGKQSRFQSGGACSSLLRCNSLCGHVQRGTACSERRFAKCSELTDVTNSVATRQAAAGAAGANDVRETWNLHKRRAAKLDF